MNYLYAKLNKQVENVKYKGVDTASIDMEVNNKTNTISANVKVDNALSSTSNRPVANKVIKDYVDNRVTPMGVDADYTQLITKLKIGNTTYMLPSGDAVDFEDDTIVVHPPNEEELVEPHNILITISADNNFNLIGYSIKDVTAGKFITSTELSRMCLGTRGFNQPNVIFELEHSDISKTTTRASLSSFFVNCLASNSYSLTFGGNPEEDMVYFYFSGLLHENARVGWNTRDAVSSTYQPWNELVSGDVQWTSMFEVEVPETTGNLPKTYPLPEYQLYMPRFAKIIYDDEEEYILTLRGSGAMEYYYTADDIGVTVTRNSIELPDNEEHTVEVQVQNTQLVNCQLEVDWSNFDTGHPSQSFSASNGYIRFLTTQGDYYTYVPDDTSGTTYTCEALAERIVVGGNEVVVEIGCDVPITIDSGSIKYQITDTTWLIMVSLGNSSGSGTLTIS